MNNFNNETILKADIDYGTLVNLSTEYLKEIVIPFPKNKKEKEHFETEEQVKMELSTDTKSDSTTNFVTQGVAEITLRSIWSKTEKYVELSPKENSIKVKRCENLKSRAENLGNK